MDKYKAHTSLPIKGLHLDNSPIKQPEGTATFILNGVKETVKGDRGSIVNEQGSEACYNLPQGYSEIGSIVMNDDEVAIFSTNGLSSEIGIARYCNYTTYVNSTDLNFSNPITGTFRLRNGDQRVIYFCDGINPDRTFNFDRVEDFQVNGNWEVALFSLRFPFKVPSVILTDIADGTGCGIPHGKYFLAFKYKDNAGNLTDVVKTTTPFVVYDDNFSSNQNQIDGAYNVDESNLSGSTPQSFKQYTFNIENLDTRYNSLVVYVIANLSGDGNTFTAYEVDNINILSNITYTFNCLDYSTLIDVNSLLIETSNYNSKVMTQSSNRLIRANLKENEIDWSKFQQSSNNIQVKYKTKLGYGINKTNTLPIRRADHSSKSPKTYFNNLSFMRDEVYALGIIYIFKDGTRSPVFHIPGRRKDTRSNNGAMPLAQDDPHVDYGNSANALRSFSHRESLTGGWDSAIVNSNSNTSHIPGSSHERWEVYNTALRETVDTPTDLTDLNNSLSSSASTGVRHHLLSTGQLGYYEIDNTYPDDLDSDGNRIYPTGNIRHHKIPDATLEPIIYRFSSLSQIYPSGIDTEMDFDLPHAQVLTSSISLDIDNVRFPFEYINDLQGYEIVATSLNTVITKGNLVNRFITEGDIGGSHPLFLPTSNNDTISVASFYSPDSVINRIGAAKASYIKFENETYTIDINQPFPYVADLTYHDIPHSDRSLSTCLYNRTIKDYGFIDPNTSLILNTIGNANAEYTNINGNTKHLISFNEVVSAISQSIPYYATYYVSLKANPLTTSLEDLDYHHVSSKTFSTLKAEIQGDTLIQAQYLTRFKGDPEDEPNRLSTRSVHYVEAKLNINLIHSDPGRENTHYYPKYSEPYAAFDAVTLYNKDFSINYDSHFKLFSGYKVDDRSLSFPARIVWSEISFVNELEDNYKVTLPNNFIDLPDGSAVNMIAELSNRLLLVASERNLYKIPTTSESLQSNSVSIYLGTGEFMSVSPQKMSSAPNGFGGCSSILANCNTEYGMFWVDQENQKIFSYSSDLDIISNKGLSQWFRENLTSYINQYFRENFNINYPLLDTYGVFGAHISIAYDPLLDRVIFHKKDYLPLFDFEIYDPSKTYLDGSIVFDVENNRYMELNTSSPSAIIASFDPDNFEDKSFTISYDVKDKTWISWHSYLPRLMYSDSKYMYISDNNNVERLGKGLYTAYFARKYPFILEIVNSDIESYRRHSFQWLGEAYVNDVYNNSITFNKIWMYNHRSSTGIVDIKISDNPFAIINDRPSLPIAPNFALVSNNQGIYKTNYLRDVIIDEEGGTTTADWSEVNNNYYIDKIPLASNHDHSKSLYDKASLNDRWVKVRLYYDTDNNAKLRTELLLGKNKKDIR